MVTWCSRGRRRRGAHGRYGEGSRSLAIKIGNQTSGTGQTARDGLDLNADSGAQSGTSKTTWTNRMALRSRWRSFESCRGRQDVFTFEDVSSSRFEYTIASGCSRLLSWVPSARRSRWGSLVVHVNKKRGSDYGGAAEAPTRSEIVWRRRRRDRGASPRAKRRCSSATRASKEARTR